MIRDKKDKCQFEQEDLIKVAYRISETSRYDPEPRLRCKDILRKCSEEMIENIKKDDDIYDERITKDYEPVTMDKIVNLN